MALLTAIAIASVSGALVAVPLTLTLRGWLGAGADGSWTLTILLGYVAWAAASAVISALWLHRRASR
jgi:hypothetical protein